jgi:hypothetical protein
MSRDEKRSYWGGVLREQAASGLSLPAFSRERRMCYATLLRWRTELGNASEVAPAGFVELLPMALDGLPRQTTADTGCGVRVLLSNGIRLELTSSFEAPALSRAALALGGLER